MWKLKWLMCDGYYVVYMLITLPYLIYIYGNKI